MLPIQPLAAHHAVDDLSILSQETLPKGLKNGIRNFPTIQPRPDENCKCFDGSLRDPKGTMATELPMSIKRRKSTKQQPARQISFAAPPAVVVSSSTPATQKFNDTDEKLIIVMVGLPARGKSYVTKKICRYMSWLQYDTKIFNVGDRRRKEAGLSHSNSTPGSLAAPGSANHPADFFDPGNNQAGKLREQVAMETLDELLQYLLAENGSVAIFDATNSTTQRRHQIFERIKECNRPELHTFFLESQCFDEMVSTQLLGMLHLNTNGWFQLLHSNMRLKLSSPDYRNQDPFLALQDFKRRVAMYEKKYVPLGDYEEQLGFSYCKMIDVGRKFITHNINGFLATQIVGYLQHFNLANRQVWFTRHHDSFDDRSKQTDSGAELGAYGLKYARTLSSFIDHEHNAWQNRQLRSLDESEEADGSLHMSTDGAEKRFQVWTSKMSQSVQTAQFFDRSRYDVEHMIMLDELNTGILEGSTVDNNRGDEEGKARYPISHGEYVDVTKRLQSVILELERIKDHVLIIGGLAIIKTLLAYCRDMRRDQLAGLDVPVGMVYVLEPVSLHLTMSQH
jgi:6-phosphofructo-2-kinase